MYLQWSVILTLLAISPVANAHGEEFLVSLYAQAISAVVCLAGLQFLPVARPHRLLGSIACIAGVMLAEFVVSDVPYDDNRVVITIAMIALPITLAAGAVVIGMASTKRKART